MKNDQSGNVIFYILIAVALLAALSYTVSNSLRGGGETIGNERQALNASEIIEYGNVVASAVAQIRLRGHKEAEISFENSAVEGYTNEKCTESECKIFDLAGGGVSYMAPKADWLDKTQKEQTLYGEIYFNAGTAVKEIGSDTNDLVMIIPYLDKPLCMALNKKLGIGGLEIPVEANGPVEMNTKFTGLYEAHSNTQISGAATIGNATALYGKMAGCTESSGGGSVPPAGTYHYFQVLIAR